MVADRDDPAQSDEEGPASRPATLEDLVALCSALNNRGARYVIIGGTAMIQLGFVRATEDIDLLIQTGENERKVIDGVATLPDHAAKEIQPGEIEKYEVIRVADEIVVDLMAKATGISFEMAEPFIEFHEIRGVKVPFASAQLMLKLKQGVREKDVLDRRFIEALLKK
jgi:hypothetical protein